MRMKQYVVPRELRINIIYRVNIESLPLNAICDTIIRYSFGAKLGSGHLISIVQSSSAGNNVILLGYMTQRQLSKLARGKSSKRNYPMTRDVPPMSRRYYPNIPVNDNATFKYFVYKDGVAYETRVVVRDENELHLYQAGEVGLNHILLGNSSKLVEFIIDSYNHRTLPYLDVVINERVNEPEQRQVWLDDVPVEEDIPEHERPHWIQD